MIDNDATNQVDLFGFFQVVDYIFLRWKIMKDKWEESKKAVRKMCGNEMKMQ